MSSQFYDVIIVGAGLAGSYAAYELASSGYRVAVLEQKSAPGLDSCCTGIISTECFNAFGISPEIIRAKVNSVRLFSPSGRCLRLESEKVQAYVIDRASLDQAIARKAQASGAHYFLSSRATDIIVEKDKAKVEVWHLGSREMFTSRAMILANGFKPKLPQKLGLGKIKNFLIGAQAEVEAHNIGEIEIYFGREIAPGSFAWLVPTSANKALAGLLSTSQAKLSLEKFLLGSFCRDRMVTEEVEIRQKTIPLGALPRTYGDRLLVIGDAAGQVKPTTGGGIYLGHLGAKMAVEVLHRALENDDLAAAQLSRYQKEWKAKMGREISLGYRARQLYGRLSDKRIDKIFNMLDSGGMAEALLNSPNFSFDWHSKLILTVLKYNLTNPLQRVWRSFTGRLNND
ncbi:MAG: NAD(P)/FAD-dependent oxidoreductase [Dehalococcoidia bacterium]|nr:NAD(P)/FAD-dependent oxidoreductase [Dehalococcoidia bacterium]